MKSSYVVRATKFLHKIYPRISCVLNSPSRVREIIQNYNRITGRAIYVHNGSTRCVLVTSDYVIKWDYSCRDVKTFGGCAEEVNMYELAKEEGYNYLLAEVTPVFYRGKLFIIMPRFNMVEEKPDLYELVNSEEYDWLCEHIGDIHENNYTIIDDYFPIIIDYACPVEYLYSSSC